MASLPPTPSGVIRFRMKANGVWSSFCMGYSGTAPSATAMTALCNDVVTQWGSHLAPLTISSGQLNFVTGLDLANPSNPLIQVTASTNGSRSGNALPSSISASLIFYPATRYRGSKPKAWMPFGVESDQTSSQDWSSTFVSAVNTGWAAFITGLSGASSGGCTLTAQVAVSYYHGKQANSNPNSRLRYQPTPRATPVVLTINSVACGVVFGSQRRRLRPG